MYVCVCVCVSMCVYVWVCASVCEGWWWCWSIGLSTELLSPATTSFLCLTWLNFALFVVTVFLIFLVFFFFLVFWSFGISVTNSHLWIVNRKHQREISSEYLIFILKPMSWFSILLIYFIVFAKLKKKHQFFFAWFLRIYRIVCYFMLIFFSN